MLIRRCGAFSRGWDHADDKSDLGGQDQNVLAG